MARGACQDTAYLQPLGKRAHAVGKVASPSFDVALRSIVLWTAHQTKIGAVEDGPDFRFPGQRRVHLRAGGPTAREGPQALRSSVWGSRWGQIEPARQPPATSTARRREQVLRQPSSSHCAECCRPGVITLEWGRPTRGASDKARLQVPSRGATGNHFPFRQSSVG